MRCPNCNSEVKDGMKFCPKCGIEISQIQFCPNCGTEIKEGTCFCPQCGININNISNVPDKEYPPANNTDSLNNTESLSAPIQEWETNKKKWLKYIAIGFACYFVLSFIMGMCSGNDDSDYSVSDVKQLNESGAKIPSWLIGKWFVRSSHPYVGEFQVAILIQEDGSFAETYQSHSITESKSGYITDVHDDEIRVKFTIGNSDSQYYPINNSSRKIGYGQNLWLNKY